MRWLGELHHRNVLRVAAAYGIVAWLLIQVADVVLPRLEAPEWTVTFVIVLLALGFPVALVLAWAFELTPEGLKRAEDVPPRESIRHLTGRKLDFAVIFILSTAVVVLLIRQWGLQEESVGGGGGVATGRSPPSSVLSYPSIAVLPFRNVSEDADNTYFAEGISEELLNDLVKLPQLKVVGRTSSFSYRNKELDLREIGEQLDARYILDGSVRKSGERVRIAVQLTDSESGYNLWSRAYNRQLSDIFSVQAQISRAVVDTLKLELLPEHSQALGNVSTRDTEAYDFYLRGLNLLRYASVPADYDRAIEFFGRALRRDPTFVEAEAGKCRALRRKYVDTSSSEFMTSAIEVCNRAATMDSRSPQVQIALGNLYLETGRAEFALEAFELAIQFAPLLDEAHRGRGRALVAMGRGDEARGAFSRAIELGPNNAENHAMLGRALYGSGKLQQAIDEYNKAVDLEPDNPGYYSTLGGLYHLSGKFDRASQLYSRSIELRPTEDAYSNAASNLYYAGRFSESLDLYKKALRLAPEPGSYVLHGNLAHACRMAEQCNDWQRLYERAIERTTERLGVNPDDAVALASKALYSVHLGRSTMAENTIQRALELAPNDLHVLWAAAVIWTQLGDSERATEFVSSAAESGFPIALMRADPDLKYSEAMGNGQIVAQ